MNGGEWKFVSSFARLLGPFVLAAFPSPPQQTPASSATPATTMASLATPEISKTLNEKLKQLDKDVKAAQSSADNAWMLVSAALVLMMTWPGLVLFYDGVVRRETKLGLVLR